jgi:hypothetical protein
MEKKETWASRHAGILIAVVMGAFLVGLLLLNAK